MRDVCTKSQLYSAKPQQICFCEQRMLHGSTISATKQHSNCLKAKTNQIKQLLTITHFADMHLIVGNGFETFFKKPLEAVITF